MKKATQEGYDEVCDRWGVYFLKTNTSEYAADVYYDWSIETCSDYIKNNADFNVLKIHKVSVF